MWMPTDRAAVNTAGRQGWSDPGAFSLGPPSAWCPSPGHDRHRRGRRHRNPGRLDLDGEPAAAAELRRRFPGLSESAALEATRMIVRWWPPQGDRRARNATG